MHYEFQNVNRETWKYTYTGAELMLAAIDMRCDYREKELAARKKVIDLLADARVPHNDPVVAEARRDIEANGKQYEACKIFAHEFERNKDREYQLALGDVVYFGLVDDEDE